MPAYKPEECDLLLYKVMEEGGDIDAMMALYEPDATFVVSPDKVVTGHAAIREVLLGLMAVKVTFSFDSVTVVPSADGIIAVTRVKGSTTSTGPDGKTVTTPFHSVEVIRRQPDGTWLIIIDDPGGEGLKT